MTRTATIDPALSARVVESRLLRYDTAAHPDEDRPDHVRAASGLAVHDGRLVVVQDDTLFFGVITPGGVSALRLPRGLDGRRRFEIALGNKLAKADLESAVIVDDELWAFGSGSLPMRDKICRVQHGVTRVIDAAPLFARCRDALTGCLNIEGAARHGDELWLFHRGNTGAADPGPAALRFSTRGLRAWLDAEGALPALIDVDTFDLGSIDGVRLGFTDAVAVGDRIYYLATAEASANAIDDGRAIGSQIGVITPHAVRATPLTMPDGAPLKAEGLAFDPSRARTAWVVIDPDDTEQPATLLDVELAGPW